jgi:hypothetical protein
MSGGTRNMRFATAILIMVATIGSTCSTAADLGHGGADHNYIPTDLNDCIRVLDEQVRSEDVEKIRTGTITASDMHLGLGLRIRNEWGLWGGSRLVVYFRALGILHPDDMSGIILQSYVRHVRHEPIRLDEQVSYYKKYWAKSDTSAAQKQ